MDEIMKLILQARQDLERGNDNSHSGDTLDEVMASIRSQPHEISAMFDQCGNKIYEHTSHHHRCSVTAIPPAYLPHLFLSVHNHPHDITFSGTDLETLVRLDLSAIIVTSPSRNYILLRPSTGWPSSDDWIEEYDAITQVLLRHPHRDYDVATARHLALMKVAQHYHLWYYVTNLERQVIASTAN